MEGARPSADDEMVGIHVLPPMMMQKIFSYLDFKDLLSVSSVCTRWNQYVSFERVWNDKIYEIPSTASVSEVEAILSKFRCVCNIKFITRLNNSSRILQNVFKYCYGLRSLDVTAAYDLDFHVLISVLERFRHIVELKLKIYQAYDVEKLIATIGTFKHLKVLEFSPLYIGIVDLTPIANGCPKLCHLNIQDLSSVRNIVYLLERKKNQLRTFIFSARNFEATTSFPLQECRNLEHVSCAFYSVPISPNIILDKVVSLPNVKRLDLIKCEALTPIMLRNSFLSKSTQNLLELRMSYLDKMSCEITTAISTRCPVITKLCLKFYYRLEGLWFVDLLKLPHLENLHLHHFIYVEDWFQQLLQCRKLTHLKLKSSGYPNDYQALELLRRLNLECLRMPYSKELTEVFIKGFPECPSLKYLEIKSISCSQEVFKDLRQRYPSIKIKISNFL